MCYLSLSKLRNPGNDPVDTKDTEVTPRTLRSPDFTVVVN